MQKLLQNLKVSASNSKNINSTTLGFNQKLLEITVQLLETQKFEVWLNYTMNCNTDPSF